MKNSDSKNSLAELNPQEPTCFICLEEGSPDFPLLQSSLLRSCGCKFFTHTDCWNKWRKDKTDHDCPYCGRRSLHLSLPMTAPLQQDYTRQMQELQRGGRKKYIFPCLLFVVLLCILVPTLYALVSEK